MWRADEDPCDNLAGPGQGLCDDGGGSGGGGGGGGQAPEPEYAIDPLTKLAREIGRAADWTASQLGKLVGDRNAVDFTNGEFLRQYAVVFAATTVLVLLLWLVAVAKRAMRGVPFMEAITEAIGFLWMTVLASAFTPLILYVLIGATSEVTEALVRALGGDPGDLFTRLGEQLKDGKVGGGPIILAIVSLATIALCGMLWLILVLRALGLYVGAVLGVVVYAGLVDKDLWGHVRRWSGVMIMLVLVEPVVVIVIGLATVLQASNDIVAGLAVTVLALGASIYMIMKVPGAGDSIGMARKALRGADGVTKAFVSPASSAAGVSAGIKTHATRGARTSGASGDASQPGPNTASGGVSGGLTAHSQRPERSTNANRRDPRPPKPRKKEQ